MAKGFRGILEATVTWLANLVAASTVGTVTGGDSAVHTVTAGDSLAHTVTAGDSGLHTVTAGDGTP